MWRATCCAPSSSPVATDGRDRGDGEGAVAERAVRDRRDDRRVDAAGERDDGGAEPAIARLKRRAYACASAHRSCPHDLDGVPVMRAARSQSACSGARLTTLPSSLPTLMRTGSPATSTVRMVALELDAIQVGDADAERARLAQHRLDDLALVAGPRERRHDEAGAAALHLRGRGPDVERAGVEAGRGGVGRELGEQVVEVGLDQRDGARSWPRCRSIARTTFGIASRSRVPAP